VSPTDVLRGDLQLITNLVPSGSRVLDLGCGDGALMAHLRDERGCAVRGVELSHQGIAACIEQGLSVVEADLDKGLAVYPDSSFDVVVLSQTIQVMRRPDLVLSEMARVGRTGIVSFPNFGHWRVRGYLAFRGRMPISKTIPYEWYDTPNIHHATIRDFRIFCERLGLEVEQEVPLKTSSFGRARRVSFAPNLFADTALMVVRKAGS
jgi:methionine biosynthesis protein MetW